jgi:hypothetical protein
MVPVAANGWVNRHILSFNPSDGVLRQVMVLILHGRRMFPAERTSVFVTAVGNKLFRPTFRSSVCSFHQHMLPNFVVSANGSYQSGAWGRVIQAISRGKRLVSRQLMVPTDANG